MKLVLPGAVSERRSDFVVRESAWGRTLLWLIIAAIGLAWCSAPLFVGAAGWFGWIFGAPCLLAVGFMASGVRRTWRGGWWILLVRSDALVLRLRSQLNADLPNEWANVVVIEREHIRAMRGERTQLHGDNDTVGTAGGQSLLVIELSEPVPAEVQRALQREANPGLRERGHFHANIASIGEGSTLRVHFRGSSVALTPGLRKSLQALKRAGYPVDLKVRASNQVWERLSDDEQDALVDSYAASGDRIAAIRLWRERHGGSLADAKAEIERRSSRLSA